MACSAPEQASPWVKPPAPAARSAATPQTPDASDVARVKVLPPAPKPVAKKPEPTRLRLIAPRSTLANVAQVAAVTAEIDGKPVAVGVARPLASANEGVAHLVVLTGVPSTERQRAALEVFVHAVGPFDRVALGVIEEGGFRLLRSFTADARPLLASAQDLGTVPPEAPPPPVMLYQGLLDALALFRGEVTLPAAKRLTLLTDGIDSSVRRRSALERLASAVCNRAAAYEVVPSVLLFGPLGAAHAALQSVAVGAGGQVETAHVESTESFEAAARSLLARTTALVAVELDVLGLAAGEHVISVRVDGGPTLRRSVSLPPPGEARVSLALPIPEPCPSALPPGMKSLAETIDAVARAEAAGDLLKAGALAHWVAEASPDSRPARERAAQFDARWRAEGSPRARLVAGADTVPVAVPTVVDLILGARTAKERALGIQGDAAFGRARPMVAESGGPMPVVPQPMPVTQLVLVPCEGSLAADCLESLLRSGRFAHLVVDGLGRVTQTADLSNQVPEVPARRAQSVVVALVTPPPEASTWLDPEVEDSRRTPRLRLTGVPVTAGFATAWDATAAQVRALVPLLSALEKHFEPIKPYFAFTEDRRPTLETLAIPDNHEGFLTQCNLVRASPFCAPPVATLERLNSLVRVFRMDSPSTAMGSWIEDLSVPGRREGAALRFGRVGAPALPLLLELSEDADLPQFQGLVAALSEIAVSTDDPALRHAVAVELVGWAKTTSARVVPTGSDVDGGGTTLAIVQLIAELGDGEAARALLAEPACWPAGDSLNPVWRLALATSTTPSASAAVELVPLLADPDVRIRSTAAAALMMADRPGAAERLVVLRDDSDPWIRYLAAVALGGDDGVRLLVKLGVPEGVLPGRLARKLAQLSPKKPVPEVVSWFVSAPEADLPLLAAALRHWKWVEAVPLLADQLETFTGARREWALDALRHLTGRDHGESADGYREWYAKEKRSGKLP